MSALTQILPATIWPGRGTACLVSGYVSGSTKLNDIGVAEHELSCTTMLHLADQEVDLCCKEDDPERSYSSGFTSLVRIPAVLHTNSSSVSFTAEFSNGHKQEIDTHTVLYRQHSPIDKLSELEAEVVICMASWEPDEQKLRRQIESIKTQTLSSWHCIINDDASSEATWKRYSEIIGEDARFSLFRNKENLGFYRNFEVVLSRVPEGVKYVALADQDDVWYPEKLTSTLAQFESAIMLVYCDMRIVDEQGSVIADSYWGSRKNNYQDADVLFLANTVTGAASVFKYELLADILPFPQAIGQVFHDHWIACVARCRGELGYVDQALYDYYQYGNSVIGQCDFEARGIGKRIVDLGAQIKHLGKLGKFKSWLIHKRFSALNVFHQEYLRLYLFAEILRIRLPDMNQDAARELRMFAASWPALFYLLKSHLRIIFNKETTDDAEMRLAAALLVFKLDRLYGRLFAGRLIRKHCQSLNEKV